MSNLDFISLFYRYNPVREAEEMPSTDDIWKLLHSKIMNSFSSVKQAFLVFDDVSDYLHLVALRNNYGRCSCVSSFLYAGRGFTAVKYEF